MAEVTYDNLVLEKYESLVEKHTLTNGESVVRGQALGLTGGKLVAYDHEAVGSEPFYGIAAEDCDADGADATIRVYVKGVFNSNDIVFEDTSDSVSNIRTAARLLGIFFKAAVGA